jgi:hypothetical protein
MGVDGHHHAPFKKPAFRWMGGSFGPKIGLDIVEDKSLYRDSKPAPSIP